jgi:putative flavoprotein involved in K+ transport
VGRVQRIDGQRVMFDDGLGAAVAAADGQLQRLLARIDDYIDRNGLASELLEPEPFATADARDATTAIHLARAGISSVVWATGHSRRYDWLELPILDRQGEIAQWRGITALPGAYVLGQRFQHFRNSNFIDGVGRDAEYVAEHISTRSTSLNPRHSNNSRQD